MNCDDEALSRDDEVILVLISLNLNMITRNRILMSHVVCLNISKIIELKF